MLRYLCFVFVLLRAFAFESLGVVADLPDGWQEELVGGEKIAVKCTGGFFVTFEVKELIMKKKGVERIRKWPSFYATMMKIDPGPGYVDAELHKIEKCSLCGKKGFISYYTAVPVGVRLQRFPFSWHYFRSFTIALGSKKAVQLTFASNHSSLLTCKDIKRILESVCNISTSILH